MGTEEARVRRRGKAREVIREDEGVVERIVWVLESDERTGRRAEVGG